MEIEAYISTQSLKAAAKSVEVVGKTLGQAMNALGEKLEKSGDLTAQELDAAKKVAKALDDGTLDLSALASCTGRQGFNLLDLIFTPAYASSGCVLFDTSGHEITELTPNERQACIEMLATLMQKYTEKYVLSDSETEKLPDSISSVANLLRKAGPDETVIKMFQAAGLSATFIRDELAKALFKEDYEDFKSKMEPFALAGDMSREAVSLAIEKIAADKGLSAQDTKDLKLVFGATAAVVAAAAGAKVHLGKATKGGTRFVDNVVVVVDRKTGKTLKGTVDLGPTLDRIKSGGSFPHRNDGSIFQNRAPKGASSPLLPVKPAGFYKEYVVPTPGVNGPGPQRVVVGHDGKMYYTPDHYDSFIPIN